MRPNTNNNNRRARGRGGRKSGNSRNQTYDSNGPGARVRGNPSQIYEKYQQLARDAGSAGDRVGAENYLQHAEHYYRLMSDAAAKSEQRSGSDEGSRDEGSRDEGSRDEGSRNEPSRDSGNGHGSFVDNLQTEDARSEGDASDDAPQSEKADDSGSRSNGRKRRSRRSNSRTAAADGNAESDGNVADGAASASDDGDSGDSGDSGGDDGEAVTA